MKAPWRSEVSAALRGGAQRDPGRRGGQGGEQPAEGEDERLAHEPALGQPYRLPRRGGPGGEAAAEPHSEHRPVVPGKPVVPGEAGEEAQDEGAGEVDDEGPPR